MLQYSSMPLHAAKRVFFPSRAFTLLEMLIAVTLIGILALLLIPNILQARQESLRQAARQQAKVVEKALAAWFTAQPNLLQASQAWGAGSYITDLNFLGTTLQPYLPDQNTSFTMDNNGIITTPEMQMVTTSTNDFIGGKVDGNDDVGYAHLRLFWDSNARTTSSPKVMLFLPNIP